MLWITTDRNKAHVEPQVCDVILLFLNVTMCISNKITFNIFLGYHKYINNKRVGRYAIPVWSGFLSTELKSQVNFLIRAFNYGFCSKPYTIEVVAQDDDIDLFCKMTKVHHCAHIYYLVLNLVRTTSNSKGTCMNSLSGIQRCIKSHCTPLPLSVYVTCICVLYGIYVFIFYFHCHISTAHVRLIRVY